MSPDKKQRPLEDDLFEEKSGFQCGRPHHQKLKPYLVLRYLMTATDENHVVSAEAIAEYLKTEYEMSAERRSVGVDIKAINAAMLMLDQGCTIKQAYEMLETDNDDELKTIVYDVHKKGFRVRQRQYDLNDIRLLAQCIHSAKFVTKGQADRLVNVLCDFVSEYQAEELKHDVYLTDRAKTNNRAVLNNIDTINRAMSRRLDGHPHQPEQIAFKYLKHEIKNVGETVERRKGKEYIVNPYALIINDGNYYMLVYDESIKKGRPIRVYRVDRMRDVRLTGTPREGAEYFRTFDLKEYAKQLFGMYGGEKRRITLRFIPPLLDTMVERFGTTNVQYSMTKDKKYYDLSAEVGVSDQFFGWLLGFGIKVHLMYPDDVVESFKAYLDKIRDRY